jgi:hypothetical protein
MRVLQRKTHRPATEASPRPSTCRGDTFRYVTSTWPADRGRAPRRTHVRGIRKQKHWENPFPDGFRRAAPGAQPMPTRGTPVLRGTLMAARKIDDVAGERERDGGAELVGRKRPRADGVVAVDNVSSRSNISFIELIMAKSGT